MDGRTARNSIAIHVADMMADMMSVAFYNQRLALLRERIDRLYAHVILPEGEEDSSAWSTTLINRSTVADWEGESVGIWHRHHGEEAYAMQEGCPHASISLKESDIEDLGQSYPGKLQGPCIACPAHTYVFDATTGHCLTDDYTPSARIYSVKRTTSGASTVLWVAREPNQPVSDQGGGRHEQGIGTDEGNAIQLLMVEKALKRRFGDDEDESAKDDDYEFFSRYA